MRRHRRCQLCGELLREKECGEYKDWEIKYCSYLCYLTDRILPPVPKDDLCRLYNIPARIMVVRYEMVVSGESDPVYNEKFEEEEDCLMRDGAYGD